MTDVTSSQDQGGAHLPAADEQLLRELSERARGGRLKLTGEGGVLGRLTKMVVEGALEGELEDHLGYSKHDPAGHAGGNSRNGLRVKTVITEKHPVEITVPVILIPALSRKSSPSGSGGLPAWMRWSFPCPRKALSRSRRRTFLGLRETELVATAIANAQARLELRGYAEEQAALRRVATLVARGVPPEDVFAAVTAEVGQILGTDYSALSRYDPDGGALTVLSMWSSKGSHPPLPVGGRMELGGRNVTTQVFETGRPARLDDHAEATGAVAGLAQTVGTRSSVGVPISVDGQLRGLMMLTSVHAPPSADTEERLAGFTELVATAVANAEARAALKESRARIVAASALACLTAGKRRRDPPGEAGPVPAPSSRTVRS